MPIIAEDKGGRLPISIQIYGPGLESEYILQRKIIKFGSYKNWRLNGEFVYNPQESLARFNTLVPGDFAVFNFTGDLCPTDAKIVFLARAISHDQALCGVFDQFIRDEKMIALTRSELDGLIKAANAIADHPINELIMDAALEDAALGGLNGTSRLLSRPSGRKTTREELRAARKTTDDIGQLGEEYINSYLAELKRQGAIEDFEWASNLNAISPYDFYIIKNSDKIFIDVKSTKGEFDRIIHISINELKQIRFSKKYNLYRVYQLDERLPQLRICVDLAKIVDEIFSVIERLPDDIIPDSFSIPPSALEFGPLIQLNRNGESDEE